MFDTIHDIRATRKRLNATLFLSGNPTFRAFEDLEAAALQDGALPRKHKELIALGISIASRCMPCVEYHVSAALDSGATRDEIIDATALAVVLAGGAATWPARFVFEVLDQHPSPPSPNH